MNKKVLSLSILIILSFFNIVLAQTPYNLTLKPGFNFISFTNSLSITPSELKSQNTSIEDIYLFSPSAGSFLSHSEGTLSTLSAGKGYIIKSNATANITINITGLEITTINPINLKAGFNLVGFSQAPLTNTFENLMINNTIIKGCYKWSPTAGSFIQVVRNEIGTIIKVDGVDPTIKAGDSYFINMYGDSTLNYDTETIVLNPSSYVIPAPKVANPLITPNGGTISSSQQISISCSTDSAEIYFTIDDSSSAKYNGPFTINKNCTIKATATKSGWTNSDSVSASFIISTAPELEVSGSLPNALLNSPKINNNYAATIGSKGNTISVVRADSENIEIGAVVINASNYTANIPITNNSYPAIILIKDNLGRILFRSLLGKMLIQSELPANTIKIKIPNIDVNATSTAMALLVKEKNIELNKITSITSNDLQNGIAIKNSTIYNEISQNFSSNPNLISEIAKAVTTISSSVLSTNVGINTVPANISTATELLSSFIKVIKEPTLQTIIVQSQLPTSINISSDTKIDSSTTVIEPILKVKFPIFSISEGIYNSTQELLITSQTPNAIIKYTLDGTDPSKLNGFIYNSTISIEFTSTIKAIALFNDMIDSDVTSLNITIKPKLTNPIISPQNKSFESTLEISIYSPIADALIKYTTDGSIPSESNGLTYNSKFIISTTTTVKAVAIKSGTINSDVVITTYTKLAKVLTPLLSPLDDKTFTTIQYVTISCNTSGATIFYTLDGSIPSSTSQKYTGPLMINKTTTIKAISIKSGMIDSEIISKEYKFSSNGYTGTVVFNSFRDLNGEIYAMNPDGTGQTRLTFNNSDDVFPSWSPDGSKIAFVSVRNGNPEIYVMNANGSNQTQLTFSTVSTYSSTYPKWSPDGTKIAYESNRSGNFEIWVVDFMGSQTRLTFNNASTRTPAWSPDGLKIAYISNVNGYYELYTMNSDGTNKKQITNNKSGCVNPAWSPDGQKILFSSNKDNYSFYEIFVIDLKTNVQTKLTNLNYNSLKYPEWSPDGSKILFSSLEGTSQNIYIMDIDGNNLKRLTTSALDYYTSWSATNLVFNVETPVFSPNGAIFSSEQNVIISCATSGATIKYTTDGSTPSMNNGTTFESGDIISLTNTTTIKAVAIKNELISAVESATYTQTTTTSPIGQTIKIDLGDGVMLEMVKINAAGNKFIIGCPTSEQDSYGNEQPMHEIAFTKDYYIGKYELTQAQWLKIYGKWPSTIPSIPLGLGGSYPAYYVSWNDISSSGGFLDKINTTKPGGYNGFRLPTEAEWEYASCAWTQTRFYWGDDPTYSIINDYSWYIDNSSNKSHPVGEKLPNAFGLYDMSGNLLEWCSDWYGSYSNSSAIDPLGPSSGSNRVVRGGGYNFPSKYCRSAFRGSYYPTYNNNTLGFRLALTISSN